MRSRSAPPCTTAQTTRPAVDPVHPQHDPPVVEADDVAGVQIGGEARVFDRDAHRCDPRWLPSTSRIVAPSRISAGPPWPVRIFGPCRSCNTAIDFPRARAASRTMVRRRGVVVVRAVRKIEPRDVHPGVDQVADSLDVVRRRSQRTNDLGVAQAHVRWHLRD